MVKKIIAPIVYLIFFVPGFIITFGVWIAYQRIFGLRSYFGRMGDLESIVLFILVAIPLLYLGNYLIQKIDHLNHPGITDHFRQSSLYYLIFIYLSIQFFPFPWHIECQSDCHGLGIGALLLFIPLLAIIINGFCLYQRRKAN